MTFERDRAVALIRARMKELADGPGRTQVRMAISELGRLANEIERGGHLPKDCCPAGHAGAECGCG